MPSPLARPRSRRRAGAVLAAALLAPAALTVGAVGPASAEPLDEAFVFEFGGCVPTLDLTLADDSVIRVPATSSGSITDAGTQAPYPYEYGAGRYSEEIRRNYAAFDVSGLPSPVVSGALQVDSPPECRGTGDPGRFRLWDVSTPVAELREQETADPARFTDLGTGRFYGAVDLTDLDADVTVPLTAAALEDVDARSASLVVGGTWRETPAATATLTVSPEREVLRDEAVTLSTTVTAPDGEPLPVGVVSFEDAGSPIEGCQDVPVVGDDGPGTAACTTSFATTGEHAVTATYSGDAVYAATTSARRTVDVARGEVSIGGSRSPVHGSGRRGWYREPVTVSFTCASRYALDEAGCPGPVEVRRDGVREVTRTATDVDGVSATASLTVRIDRVAPRLRLTRDPRGRTFSRIPSLRCVASDRHSGLHGSCDSEISRVGVRRDGRRVFGFTVTVRDVAGNARQRQGRFLLR